MLRFPKERSVRNVFFPGFIPNYEWYKLWFMSLHLDSEQMESICAVSNLVEHRRVWQAGSVDACIATYIIKSMYSVCMEELMHAAYGKLMPKT